MRLALRAVGLVRMFGMGWRHRAGCVLGRGGSVARPRSANPRIEVVTVRLTAAEAAQVDRGRGRLTRAEWVRWLLLQDRKR